MVGWGVGVVMGRMILAFSLVLCWAESKHFRASNMSVKGGIGV